MAELERDQIRQHQKEGIAISKWEGKYCGSQKKYIEYYLFEELYKQWKKGDITQKYICEKLKISRRTLYINYQLSAVLNLMILK